MNSFSDIGKIQAMEELYGLSAYRPVPAAAFDASDKARIFLRYSQNSVPAEGIAATDLADAQTLAKMDKPQQYNLITQELVWEKLKAFVQRLQ